MAYELAKVVSAFFQSEDWSHEVRGEEGQVILTGVGGKKNIRGIDFAIFFDPEKTVHIAAHDYVRAPEDKKEAILPVLNQLNREYRWAKFTIDDDCDIALEADGVLDLDTCGEETLEIILRLAGIADDAYPTIMRAIYGA